MWPDVWLVDCRDHTAVDAVVDESFGFGILLLEPVFLYYCLQAFVVPQVPDLDNIVHGQAYDMVGFLVDGQLANARGVT